MVAYEQGYNPETDPVFKDEFFEDAPHSGHPMVVMEGMNNQILDQVQKDQFGREMTGLALSTEFPVSAHTIH